MSEYLWDRSGAPDPEVAELEWLLAPFALQSGLPRKSNSRRALWRAAIGIAACVVVAIGLGVWVAAREGSPTEWSMADGGRVLRSGERVRADEGRMVEVEAEKFGRVQLQPGSELRVMDGSSGHQKMTLQKGSIHVLIWAPPGQFVVDTPSARAIDLGCQYELSVDSRGDGSLRVETGWVAFQAGRYESFIPAGAACRTRKRSGPGVPYFEDAATEFRSALERFESSRSSDALRLVLAGARQEDALSLWHLLSRAEVSDRGLVFDRFAQLVNLPGDVSREKVVAGDRGALDACWNALRLSDVDWWRTWKREWR